MVFSYNWLQSFFAKKLPPPKKLAELLTMHSFEVKDLKETQNPKPEIKDWGLDIDILPNRASDCFSHWGVARECSALTKFKVQSSKFKVQSSKLKSADFVEVEVENKEDCPRYSAKVITGVKAAASSKWLQDRLRVCGLQPINNIVDAANYVMLELGQPLHAFDLDKVKGAKIRNPESETRNKSKIKNPKFQTKKILVRRAKKGEKLRTLDGKSYDLDGDVLVIADEGGPVAIAGIKGGEGTAVDKSTRNIIIEAANFDRKAVRVASQKLKLRTDASLRFEHGLDPNLIDIAQERAAYLIRELGGGELGRGLADFYPEKTRQKTIKLDLDYVSRLLGIQIKKNEARTILESIGFNVKNQKFNVFEVQIPTFRLDINIQEDLIEELGRLYGYEKISAVFPKVSLVPAESSDEFCWLELAQNTLKELGFSEVYNYSFISQKDKDIFGFRDEALELENPISSDFRCLRPTLLVNLLKNVKENSKYLGRFLLFETGKIFKRTQNFNLKPETSVSEKRMLSGLIFDKAVKINKNVKNDVFYELKGVCDVLLEELGIAGVWYDEYQPSPEDSVTGLWCEGRCAEIKTDREELGFLGEISAEILSRLGIESSVYAFDLDLEKLLKYASEEQEYQPIARYPAAVRDVAVLVPLQTKVEDVLNVIEVTGGRMVRDVDLFDIYEGEELPEGKKNLAFHIILQDQDRTLNAEEIDDLMKKIMRALEENAEWEVRK